MTTGASVTSSVINTLNTIIGSGILVLPYAFKTDSILLGLIILLIASITNSFGLYLQGVSSKFLKEGEATFFTVCLITYPNLSLIFDFAIALQCFGVDVSYLVLTGDLMPLILPISNMTIEQMRLFYILISLIITLPLCCMKKLDSLKYASVISLAAIGYLCILVHYHFFESLINPGGVRGDISLYKPQGFKAVFKTLAIVVLAYTCPNQFSIISELENPTMKRISKIIIISSILTTCLFVSMGLSGYLTFGDLINGNIILMYRDTFATRLGRALLILMVLLSYPLMFHPARISVNNICHWLEVRFSRRSSVNLEVSDVDDIFSEPTESTPLTNSTTTTSVPLSSKRFKILTVILLITSYILAIKLKSFELILSIVGSTGGVLISFVLPGCYGYKLINTNDSHLIDNLIDYSPKDCSLSVFKSELIRKLSLLLVIWGILIMFICLYSTLVD
ncbi:hypothetical protein CANARDRAFT_6444 [[Candida] arabinofermentans NRRL YB-2248]|uniref:Amino acid transporter transmembrane domain-containing protein n=1 Tax=[Candida] arabinofermentans NRRL YB-2248 TaxID=983967 RepID=A0A1E4T547_9ASCO|nr:hypothetical protein CANARDRAFT_6444 [[Candida] arabinofermentans NRRL YB-2248]